MCYPVAAELMTCRKESDWNTNVSEIDKQFGQKFDTADLPTR